MQGGWLPERGRLNHNVTKFCELKGLSKNLERAFISYCQSLMASQYEMKPDGETIRKFVSEMKESEIQNAWINFIRDVASTTPKILA